MLLDDDGRIAALIEALVDDDPDFRPTAKIDSHGQRVAFATLRGDVATLMVMNLRTRELLSTLDAPCGSCDTFVIDALDDGVVFLRTADRTSTWAISGVADSAGRRPDVHRQRHVTQRRVCVGCCRHADRPDRPAGRRPDSCSRDMRPQVVAHRGASHENAEHTLGAYLRALDIGAEALECDVRLTSDGHLVCVHDRDLRRTASTKGVVSTMRLADLDELDFASWKNPWSEFDDEAPDQDVTLGKVLTLRKLLETVADYDRRIELAIETKHPVRYSGLVERRLVEMLRDFGWDRAGSPARVMSFSYRALQRTRKLAPGIDVVMLIKEPHHWPALKPMIGDDWKVGPGIVALRESPSFARRLGRTGRDIHVWTVNTEEDLQICLDHGVKAVISDRPAYMLELLDR